VGQIPPSYPTVHSAVAARSLRNWIRVATIERKIIIKKCVEGGRTEK